MLMKKIFVVLIYISMIFGATAQVLYVKADGTGDGSSWVNASGDLKAVLNSRKCWNRGVGSQRNLLSEQLHQL